VCRADNNEGPACRRCRADLSLLFALEVQRENLLARIRERAQAGDWPIMIRLAKQALEMRNSDDARQLLAIAWLMEKNFARAWETYQSQPQGQ
jgi:hypothetical protein